MAHASFGRRSLCGVLLLLFGLAGRVHAQDVTEVTLKGAFLFNFARFTEWPADALQTDSPVSACVLGDRAVGDAFSRTVKGKQLAGRAIARDDSSRPTGSLPTCHLLYLSGVADSRVAEIVAALRDLPVLTVSDSEAFTKRGGIVQILRRERQDEIPHQRPFGQARATAAQFAPPGARRSRGRGRHVGRGRIADAPVDLRRATSSVAHDFEHLSIDWARRFTAWKRQLT